MAARAEPPPPPGKVSVQIHAVRVLPSVRRDAVWVQRGDDPKVDVRGWFRRGERLRDANPLRLVAVDATDHEDFAHLVGVADLDDVNRTVECRSSEQFMSNH